MEKIKDILLVFFIICFIYHLFKIVFLNKLVSKYEELGDSYFERYVISGTILKQSDKLDMDKIKREAFMYKWLDIMNLFDVEIKEKQKGLFDVEFSIIKVKKEGNNKDEKEI